MECSQVAPRLHLGVRKSLWAVAEPRMSIKEERKRLVIWGVWHYARRDFEIWGGESGWWITRVGFVEGVYSQTLDCILPAFILFYLILIMTRVLFEHAPWSVPFAKGHVTGKWPSWDLNRSGSKAATDVPGLHGSLSTCCYWCSGNAHSTFHYF